jgi:hypothetical protein
MDVCYTQTFNWLSVILNNEFILVCGTRNGCNASPTQEQLIRRIHLIGRMILNSAHCKSRRANSARGSSTRLYTWTTSSTTHPRRISSYWARKMYLPGTVKCALHYVHGVLGVLYATKHSWLAMTKGCNIPHIHAEHELIYGRLSQHGQQKRNTFCSLFVRKQCVY